MSNTLTIDQASQTELPAAGWYPDPASTNQLRWWGGLAWTEHLKPTEPERPWLTEMSTTPSYGKAQNYVPFATDWLEPARPTSPRRGANTTPIWLLAFTPIVTVALQIIVAWVGSTSPLAVVLAAQLSQVALFVGLILWDRASIRGLELTPSSAWWLLLPSPIVYLIVRRVTLRRQNVISHAPSNVYVLVLLLALAGGLLVQAVLLNLL